MNKELQRLIELLKTDKDLKKRIEKVEFGCWVKIKKTRNICRIVEVSGSHIYTTKYDWHIDAVDIIGKITWIDLLTFINNIFKNSRKSLFSDMTDNIIHLHMDILYITPGLEIMEQPEEVIKQIADWIEDNVLNTKTQ